MKAIKSRPSFVGGLVLGLLLAGSGFALAAIPDSNGTISTCVTVKSGAIRVIDTDKGQRCHKKEQLLTWSQTGTPGGGGSFVLRNNGVDLGVIANESSGCWVVWDGTEFRSYNTSGAPCENVVKPAGGVFYSGADCTGDAYLVSVGTLGPRGPYGIDWPIVETLDSNNNSVFRLIEAATQVGSETQVLSSNDSLQGCVNLDEPFSSSILSLVTFGSPIPVLTGSLTVAPG